MRVAIPGVLMVCCLGASRLGAADAQESLVPSAEARIRVHSSARAEPIVGTLAAADKTSLTITSRDGSVNAIVARADVSRLERSVKRSRKKKGALMGLGVGFGVGLAGTFILCESFGTSCPTGEGFVYGTIYGTAVGALGAAVGALVSHGEQWADVPLDLVHSGDQGQHPPPSVEWTIIPQVGHRRGVAPVVSF